ncbi:MAG: hypothetical protein EZS28_009770 [Streblomastix strix]|uniref:Uncharacterized protein n=1 Tax=Streblomastix strix TaxID=222440 RepID=A0A5J4WIA9_9EUKA|nr:MAG: hypothetical protein EZS28_009770 [Streblomastix strix]
MIFHLVQKVEHDATPLSDGTATAGISTEYSLGNVGSASTYARSDQQHPIQTEDTIPNSDSAEGSYGESYNYRLGCNSIKPNVSQCIACTIVGIGEASPTGVTPFVPLNADDIKSSLPPNEDNNRSPPPAKGTDVPPLSNLINPVALTFAFNVLVPFINQF